MNNPQYPLPDADRSRLRATVATIEREISDLPRSIPTDANNKATTGLAASWADLVKQLALGPEPELRACPVCNQMGVGAATICGYCWTKLTPLR